MYFCNYDYDNKDLCYYNYETPPSLFKEHKIKLPIGEIILKENPFIPKGEIHLKDKEGNLITKIINIGT